MTAPLLETHDLVKDYVIGGEVLHAVNSVSLTIKRGEFVAIMGASGSGKSTFMNMIGCLDVPTSATAKSALYFNSSTFWPAPARWTMSRYR